MYCEAMLVPELIATAGPSLTTAERRVAEVVLEHPQVVAFGTVAEVSARSGSGAATVVRLAAKLGFDGFSSLQDEVRRELSRQLRPAAERIREPADEDPIRRHLELELDNVRSTLSALRPELLEAIVGHLADLSRAVLVISGDASGGVARQLTGDLLALRDGVELVDGNPVAVRRRMAAMTGREVVLALDLRRYDHWVVDAVESARATGCWVAALTDSLLSPLAAAADATVVVNAASAGPFDSHVGTLAVGNLVVAACADRLRRQATDRLGRAEAAWTANGDLIER
jgi:DNA-binding MurR/RpiR family transcriptional regulator